MILPEWEKNVCHEHGVLMRLMTKVSRPHGKSLSILGGQQKPMDMLSIIYSADAVGNKLADVEQGSCPWQYLLIDVMCVFMES